MAITGVLPAEHPIERIGPDHRIANDIDKTGSGQTEWIRAGTSTSGSSVALREAGKLTNDLIITYLNRIGDLLFVVARYQDRELPIERATGERS